MAEERFKANLKVIKERRLNLLLLSKKTIISVSDEEAIILGHMSYAAYKLWNVANYQKRNYEKEGLTSFPNWYYQKKFFKTNIWY